MPTRCVYIKFCIYFAISFDQNGVYDSPVHSEQTERTHIAITCARELEGELPAPGGVWEAQSRWPWPLAVLVPGSHANQPGSRVEGRRRARRAGSRETRRLGGSRQAASKGRLKGPQ